MHMEVTLKIESHQLGETVVDLFKSLTKEQREQIARDTLAKWFTDPYELERAAFEARVIAELRTRHTKIGGYYSDKYFDDQGISDSQIRSTDEYRDQMRKYRSSREVMISTAVDEAVKQYKESVVQLVKEDPKLTAAYEAVKAKIEGAFPKMVQTALIAWFAQNLSRAVLDVPNDTYNMQIEIDGIKESLLKIGEKLQQG